MADYQQDDLVQALAHYRECLALLVELSDQFYIANLVEAIASVCIRLGCVETGVRLFGASETLREVTHTAAMPRNRSGYDDLINRGRMTLGSDAFSSNWREGRGLTQAETVTLALSAAINVSVPARAKLSLSDVSGLTTRETDVLRLLCEGLTNQQIADQLVISSRTVNTHLTAIFAKLGVSTRTAATRYALDHHLIG